MVAPGAILDHVPVITPSLIRRGEQSYTNTNRRALCGRSRRQIAMYAGAMSMRPDIGVSLNAVLYVSFEFIHMGFRGT